MRDEFANSRRLDRHKEREAESMAWRVELCADEKRARFGEPEAASLEFGPSSASESRTIDAAEGAFSSSQHSDYAV